MILTTLTAFLFTSGIAICQTSDAALLGQGDSYVAVADGFSALTTNPAGFRLGEGHWTLIQSGPRLGVGLFGPSALDQARDDGFSAGLGAGVGYVGGGLGLGVLFLSDAVFGPEEGLLAGSFDTTITLVGGYSYPLRLLGADVSVGGALRPMLRIHSPLDEPESVALIEALTSGRGLIDSFSSVDTYFGVALAFDLGVLMSVGPMRFGLSARDVGGTHFIYSKSDWTTLLDSIISLRGLPEGTLTDEVLEIPMVASFGVALIPSDRLSIHTEIRDFPLWMTGDIGFLNAFHAGIASSIGDRVVVRAGFSAGRPTFGGGLGLGGFELDLAYLGRSFLGADNRGEVPLVAMTAAYHRHPRSRRNR